MNNPFMLTPDFSSKLSANKSASANSDTSPHSKKEASPLEAADKERNGFKKDMERAEQQTHKYGDEKSPEAASKPEKTPDKTAQEGVAQTVNAKQHGAEITSGEPTSNGPALQLGPTLANETQLQISTLELQHSDMKYSTEMSTELETPIALTEITPTLSSPDQIVVQHVNDINTVEGDALPAEQLHPIELPVLQNLQQASANILTETGAATSTAANTAAVSSHIPSAVKMVEKLVLEKIPVNATGQDNWNVVNTGASDLVMSSGITDNNFNSVLSTGTGQQNPTPVPVTPVTQLSVSTPVQQPQWGEAVAEKVMWMSAKGIKEADIQLDPPELGPLSVKVSVSQEQAHVSFTVQHASVREALDQHAMRLREMFEQEGINLADVDVSDHSQSDQQEQDDEQLGLGTNSGAETEEELDVTETPLNSNNDNYSLIDSYV